MKSIGIRFLLSKRIGYRVAILAAALVLLALRGSPCSWATGYSYQVTCLRGQVVGANLGPLQSWSWLRHRSVRKNAKLALYSYPGPSVHGDAPLIKTVTTDKEGHFDFGKLEAGHYTLIVDDTGLGYSTIFDVQITNLLHETESVRIDASLNLPDCTGGHEFIVKEAAGGIGK